MNKSKTERAKRHYLHQKLKGVCNLNSMSRTIIATPEEAEALKENKHIKRLINDYNYTIQLTIN